MTWCLTATRGHLTDVGRRVLASALLLAGPAEFECVLSLPFTARFGPESGVSPFVAPWSVGAGAVPSPAAVAAAGEEAGAPAAVAAAVAPDVFACVVPCVFPAPATV